MPAATPPRARRRRAAGRRLALGALLAFTLLAAAGHGALWWTVCARLEEGFAAWAAGRRAEGWRVEHGPTRRGGWPLAATLAVPGFGVQGGADLVPDGVRWRAETPLVLRIAPPRLDRLAVEASGGHRVDLGGAGLRFAADRLHLALPLRSGAAPDEAAVAAQGLRFDTPAGPAAVRAASLDFGAGGAEATTALRLSAADVALPPGLPLTDRLGPIVDRVGLDTLLTGAVPPGRDPARRAAAWRDGGGKLEVRSLDARWGEVAASAAAVLTLDSALQPAGAGTLGITGGDALLDAAAGAGLLPPFSAAAARLALRALNRAPPGGGPTRAEVPMALRNRSLALGGIPLARLPALDWGAPGPGGDPARRAD